jgi:hypothetical protein
MKKPFSIAAVAIAALCSPVAQSQTTGTNLAIHAHWDTGSAVEGVVTLAQVNATGPQSILVTKSLSKGGASFRTALSANAVYDVNLNGTDGTQLASFPLTTALINPANLEQAGITLVFNSANKSLKSASVNVNLNF